MSQKTSVIYIYSNQDDVAMYLQYLIDKVRKIDSINFNPICIEEHKSTAKSIKKMEHKLAELVAAQDYEMAADERANLTRYKLADKYSSFSPIFIFSEGTEDEFMISGSKKSMARMLDVSTRIVEAANFMSGVDFSGFENTIQTVMKIAIDATKNNDAGEGLETTQEQTSVT